MTDIGLKLNIPERLERRARKEGLLSSAFMRKAIERELLRRDAARRLVEGARRIKDAGLPPLTAEEVEAEVHAVREARRRARANRR